LKEKGRVRVRPFLKEKVSRKPKTKAIICIQGGETKEKGGSLKKVQNLLSTYIRFFRRRVGREKVSEGCRHEGNLSCKREGKKTPSRCPVKKGRIFFFPKRKQVRKTKKQGKSKRGREKGGLQGGRRSRHIDATLYSQNRQERGARPQGGEKSARNAGRPPKKERDPRRGGRALPKNHV